MILIKNIEYVWTEKSYIEIMRRDLEERILVQSGDKKDSIFAAPAIEFVRGRRFNRPSDGMELVIGATKECQEILGLQYECWESMDEEIAHSKGVIKRYNDTINRAKKATLWERLRWVFMPKTMFKEKGEL